MADGTQFMSFDKENPNKGKTSKKGNKNIPFGFEDDGVFGKDSEFKLTDIIKSNKKDYSNV